MTSDSPIRSDLYYIGAPVWNCQPWKGSVYRDGAPRDSWLNHYSQTFNTVEGNSTFYGIPKIETFQRWADETADGFRFALKFPRSISHDQMLMDCQYDLDLFLAGLQALHSGDRLGPTFLQLGPRFDPGRFGSLVHFLESLPQEFRYAVEVRHPDFFASAIENELNTMLSERSVDRVIFDSRPLFSGPPSDEIELKSQSRKPRSPVRPFCTSDHPILRIVGRNDVSVLDPWIEEWAPIVATWIDDGRRPYIFTHAPDDAVAPEFARRFHNRLCEEVSTLRPLDRWPMQGPEQQTLF